MHDLQGNIQNSTARGIFMAMWVSSVCSLGRVIHYACV